VKRMMSVAVALIVAAGVMVAAPANADDQKPLSGKMELTFYGVPCTVEEDSPFLTWAGTVAIDGERYGWADFPTAPLGMDGKFIYFEEYWTIFTLGDGEAVTPAIACDADRVVLAGFNDGWGSPGLTAKADGTVTSVEDPGPFDEVAPLSRMFWRGKVTDGGSQFKATLHIQPVR
jgi:hypothetical protein